MKKSLYYLLSLLFLVFLACSKESTWSFNKDDNQIYFSSTISGLPQTRVQGTLWSTNDEIGIFMIKHGVPFTTESILENGFNKSYLTAGNGNFSPKNTQDALLFPKGESVDFVAYYPYQQGQSLKPKVDVTNQSNQSNLDFMVAQNNSGLSQGLVNLSFERQMTKVELKINGTDLVGLKAAFVGLLSVATFDLSKNDWEKPNDIKDIQANVYQNPDNETIVEWTLFPMIMKSGEKIVFTKADGKTFTWNIAAETSFAKGNRYQYDINLGQDGSVDPMPTVSYMELPEISTTAALKYSLKMANPKKRNYSMLYDTQNQVAYWVAYPLSSDYLGDQKRTDQWAYDPDYSKDWQADLSGGYFDNTALQLDRGHQLPSADRTANFAENASTFYYTNMTPQNRNLNQQLWQALEDKIRTWTSSSGVDTMYVVTGAMLTTKSDTKIDYVLDVSKNKVAKPKYYYKALAMKKGNKYYTVGFRMNNEAHPNREYMNYTVTVDSLEKETGFTFFPALNKVVKSTIDNTIWKK